jgi:NAD(P)-dependent dehydrogenase (short-subunit alcohol dehydrogenase family)
MPGAIREAAMSSEAAGPSANIQIFDEALGRAPGRGRLAGRKILVVGAGQRVVDAATDSVGNGRAIAILAAREGASVACADVNGESAAATARLIESEGGKAHAIAADIGRGEDIERMIADAASALGGLDGLVVNVGISGGVPLGRITAESWDHELGINLRGHVLTCQSALPHLAEGSAVVLMSSLASLRPNGRNPAYEASKAALGALGRSVALAGEPRGIRCNVVAPGLIDTPLGRVASQRRSDRARQVPFGRQGTGWEVAYATIFLISNEASYVNAHVLMVDGGLGSGIAR